MRRSMKSLPDTTISSLLVMRFTSERCSLRNLAESQTNATQGAFAQRDLPAAIWIRFPTSTVASHKYEPAVTKLSPATGYSCSQTINSDLSPFGFTSTEEIAPAADSDAQSICKDQVFSQTLGRPNRAEYCSHATTELNLEDRIHRIDNVGRPFVEEGAYRHKLITVELLKYTESDRTANLRHSWATR